METKLFDFSEIKLAVSSDTEAKTISGYGAVFNNTDAGGDVIAPGAFADSLKNDALPLMFLNHNAFSLPIGKWTKMEEDAYGLRVEGELIDTTAGRDVLVAVKAGAITGMSIGYAVREKVQGKSSRVLKKLDLKEISVVTFPMNDLARITGVKALEEANDFERRLMFVGLTLKEAKSFLKDHKKRIEHKYVEAAELEVARNLLSKFQGEA